MSKIGNMEPFSKRKIILKIILGYMFALSLLIGIVFFSLIRLDKIKETVNDLTNKLAVTRSFSQGITGKIRLVRFYAERYRRFHRQEDLDQFNEKIVALKKGLKELGRQVSHQGWLKMIQDIHQKTRQYETQFENITRLIMLQQSLLSTIFLKQELLIENQLSAIRINVGIVQKPDIFFSFGNARNAFQLMRLYQSKYLHEDDEKYYVMFKSNYGYASNAFSELKTALEAVPKNSRIELNAVKANAELKIYYETFLKIHSASISLKKLSKELDRHELAVTQIASAIASRIEEEYKVQNKITHTLVRRTQIEMVVAVIIAISLSLGLIFVVSQKITAPLFQTMQREAEELKIAKDKAEMAFAQLTETKQQLDLSLDAGRLGSFSWDIKTDNIIVDDRWAGMLGYKKEDINHTFEGWKQLLHPDDITLVLEYRDRHLKGVPSDTEIQFRMRSKTGEFIWILARGKIVVRGNDGKPIRMAGTHMDITHIKETEQRLNEATKKAEILAVTDTLTGLNNRLKLDQELNKEFQRAKRYGNPFSIILLDIDKFKIVNDTFGHPVGDQTLKEVSSILLEYSRKTDIVGRWGGEEFLFICPETNLAGALHLAEILRNMIETHDFPVIGKKTSSFGVACYLDGDKIQTIMERVDKALYIAKEKGRNRVEVS